MSSQISQALQNPIGLFRTATLFPASLLDENQSFIFCKDVKNVNKQSINRDCSSKVMVWYANADRGLDVIDTSLYQAQTSKIEVKNKVIFNGTASINTDKPLIIDGGCLANSTDKTCTSNQIKTDKILVKNSLGLLSDKLSGGANTVTFDAGNIILNEVNLGPVDNRHFICATVQSCTTCPLLQPATGYIKAGWNPNIHGTASNNLLACDLNITFTGPAL